MDLLSKRYADPYLILDDFIRLQQLHEFLETIMQSIAEEKVQDIRWEYYLHKVWDMSFEEYIAACGREVKPEQKPTLKKDEVAQIIQNSNDILEEFALDPFQTEKEGEE